MDIMIDFNKKEEREEIHKLLKQGIKEAGEFIVTEVPTGTLVALEKLIDTQERIIEEQEERIAIMSEGGWHKTAEEKPKLKTDFPFESITVICADKDNKYERTYPLKWCRRKVRGKIVYRWEYMYDNICYSEPDYWQYFPEPPKEGET